jgi:hypothetical protein
VCVYVEARAKKRKAGRHNLHKFHFYFRPFYSSFLPPAALNDDIHAASPPLTVSRNSTERDKLEYFRIFSVYWITRVRRIVLFQSHLLIFNYERLCLRAIACNRVCLRYSLTITVLMEKYHTVFAVDCVQILEYAN